MKPTKIQETEIWQVYNTWLTAYLNADVKTYDAYFDDDYHFIGSTNNEEFLNRNDTTKFFESTGEQFAGITDLRNEIKYLEVFDTSIFLTHFFDAWFLNDKDWTYYGRFRFSSVMQKKNEGWRFIYQHFSMPDSKSDEGETIGFDKVNAENIELKEAIKRRTIELESKNRELEVEAALERVRARTMGMQKAEELGEVATVLFSELDSLVDDLWTCGFVFCEKNRQEDEWWLSLDNGLIQPFFLPNVGDYTHRTLYEGWENGEAYRTVTLENEMLQEHYDWLMNIPIAKQIFEDMEASGIPRPNWQRLHAAYFKTGYLVLITEVPCEEEEIFKRFAQVFDLTYTRFLDLQKSEAQAREARIEAALEKVRSRTMAMQKGEELKDVAVLLYKELIALGVTNFATCGYVEINEETNRQETWVTSPGGNSLGLFHLPLTGDVHFDERYEAWKKQQTVFHQTVAGKERRKHLEYAITTFNSKEAEEMVRSQFPDPTVFYCFNFSHGYLHLVTGSKLNKEEEILLARFTRVFEQTYARFLDLQKAEKQAREAEIQLALERVRARSLAMHRSEELADISLELVKQVQTLGMESWFCAFNIYDDDPRGSLEWGSNGQGTFPKYRTPREGVFLRYFEAGQRGETFLVNEIGEEACTAHYEYLCSLPGVGEQLLQMKAAGIPFPTSQIDHVAFFKYGYVLFITYEPAPESHDIFQRFAKVFEQTYTRFLDLQKLEAQALRAEKDLIAIKAARQKAEETLTELKATQEQLIQQEKLASLGQLTAGIAHEIKNPLNFVNNFSEVSIELIEEALEEVQAEKTRHAESPDSAISPDAEASTEHEGLDEITELLGNVKTNLTKIHEHGTRANGIVSSMLQHSRGGSGKKEPTDLNALIREYVNLSFHGMRAGKNPINVDIQLDLDDAIVKIALIEEDFSRVLLNLTNNAFDAMRQKTLSPAAPPDKGMPEGWSEDNYHPKLHIRTKLDKKTVLIEIEDNGPGIPEEIKDKILQPFFTTKKGTEGTGLGLSITNDIVKAHGGMLKVNSKINAFTAFIIQLPV